MCFICLKIVRYSLDRIYGVEMFVFIHVVFWICMWEYEELRSLYLKWLSRTQANTKLLQKLHPDFSGHILLPYPWNHPYDFKTHSKDTTKLEGPPLFQLSKFFKAYCPIAEAIKDKSLSNRNLKSLQFPELYTKLGNRLNSRFYIIVLVSK